MTDGEHALKWLRKPESMSESFAPALDSLRSQHRHLQESLRDGFETRAEVVEWCHAVDVVGAGQTPSEWHSNLIRDRWRMACLISDDDVRNAITEEAPDDQATRQSVRTKTIRSVLLPAFQSVLGMLRDRVGEFTDGQSSGIRDAERMQYVLGRPRLHQRAVEQHDVLHTALHNSPSTQPGMMDWGEDVIHATEGRVDEDFIETVLDRHGDWWHALVNGPGVRLEWLLVDDVLPAMNATLAKLAEGSNELADTVGTPREVPSG